MPQDALLSVFSEEVIRPLLFFRFITLYKKHAAYVLTGAGNRFLNEPPPVRPSYREDDCSRRSRSARFLLTAYRAGLSVFNTELTSLQENGSCYLTAQARVKGSNPWGSTRMAALLRLGNTVCAVHYVCDGIGKLSLTDEMNAFMNNTANMKDVKRAMIFTGESCEDVYAALAHAEDDPTSKLVSYGELFRRSDLPVYIIPHSELGASQLHVMLDSDYRTRMAKVALSSYYEPPPREHPEWDALFNGAPLLVAADMDLKRLDAAAQEAAKSRYGPAVIVALKGQERVLAQRYKRSGLARSVNTFKADKDEVLEALRLFVPSDRQFETTKGTVIHVPPIPTARKAKRSAQK